MPFDLIVSLKPRHLCETTRLQLCNVFVRSDLIAVPAERKVHTRKVEHLEGLCGWVLRLGEGTHYGGKQLFINGSSK